MSKLIERTLREITSFIKQAVYSEKYAERNGLMQSIDARMKLLAVLAFITIAAFSRNLLVIFALFFIANFLAALSRIPPSFFCFRIFVFIPIFAGIVTLPAAFNIVVPGEELVQIISFDTWHLAITKEGLLTVATIVSRVTVTVSFTVLLTLTTKWHEIMHSLRYLFIPKIFILILIMVYRYIFLFLEMLTNMFLSRKSRNFGKLGFIRSWRVNAPLINALFIKSYAVNEKVYFAMLARGFDGEMRVLKRSKLDLKSIVFLCVNAIIAALSTNKSLGGQKNLQFLSLHIILAISCNLELQATPPPKTSSFFPVWAKARSAASTSIAKAVSCIEKAKSETL